MSAFVQSTPFETEHIAAMLAAGEFIPPAVHRISVVTDDGLDGDDAQGGCVVRHQTNDDDDDGFPDGQWATWAEGYDSVELALERVGKCRIGISGVVVTVTLDGVEQR
jgi:hypothetical protein